MWHTPIWTYTIIPSRNILLRPSFPSRRQSSHAVLTNNHSSATWTVSLSSRAFASWKQTSEQGAAKVSAATTGTNDAANSWAAIAALAGSALMGAGMIAACDANPNLERRRKFNVMDPRTFPTPDEDDDDVPHLDLDADIPAATVAAEDTNTSSPYKASKVGGLQDPMTIYAKMAVKQALKGGEQAAPATVAGSATQGATAQATSPTEERKNRMLEEQKEAIIEREALANMTPEELKIEEATRKAKQHSGGLKLFSGNGNMALSLEICRYLGINLGKATVGKFADGECNVVVHENVRGKDCYVIQPTCPPVNDNIMELLLMVSTLRRASARRITVVIPYYGYARQDRKMQVRRRRLRHFWRLHFA